MEQRLERAGVWSNETLPRFWWHKLPGMQFTPSIYSDLRPEEWEIIRDWYAETNSSGHIGEVVVPLMSVLHGFNLGSRPERIVQLGTHAGYSALLIGFMLRRAGVRRGLFSIDIDPELLTVARRWIRRAQLEEFVELALCDSRDLATRGAATDYLGGAPELVFLDSSHEYRATLQELDLWFKALAPGGMIAIHDASRFAQSFDVTQEGGVRRAFLEWRAAHPECESFLLNGDETSMDLPRPFYKDACGLALIHKPRQT